MTPDHSRRSLGRGRTDDLGRTSGRVWGGLLDPWPADPGAGVKFTEVTDGGPNQTLWFADSLKTTVRVRMQVLQDFRADAKGKMTFVGDSIYADCFNAGVASQVCP